MAFFFIFPAKDNGQNKLKLMIWTRNIVSKIQFQGVYFLIVLSVSFQTPSTGLRPDVSQEKPEYLQIVNFYESSTATVDFGDWRITLEN